MSWWLQVCNYSADGLDLSGELMAQNWCCRAPRAIKSAFEKPKPRFWMRHANGVRAQTLPS
jgi:hypothetical protein